MNQQTVDLNDKAKYRAGTKAPLFILKGLVIVLWLICPLTAISQTTVLVFDGITGIDQILVQNDTALITRVIKKSPAHKAGIIAQDRIIAIDNQVVSGVGMSQRGIRKILHKPAGTSLSLQIQRPGQEELLSFTFQRDPYLFQITSYDYMYLVDTSQQWDIHEILSPSLDTLFQNPLDAKITVHSVEEGSAAQKLGLLPGDKILSLAEEMDLDFDYHIGYDLLGTLSSDNSLTILRGDSTIYKALLSSLQDDLAGITSQFEVDFSHPTVWLKILTENRISASRTYLINVPDIEGKDSLNFFYSLPSGEVVEKKAGILYPVKDRDFVYKHWHAFKVDLNKGEKQSFYLRWKAEKTIEAPRLQVYAHETIVRYDRFERMVFISFLFTMLLISAFYLMLFAVMKGRQYLYFALYIGSMAIFLFITDGYLGEYFWKENNFFLKFLEKYQPYIMAWLTVFFLMFGVAYLELRRVLKHWYRAVFIVIILIFVRLFMVLFEAIFDFTYPEYVEDISRIVWIITVGIIPLFILIIPAIIRIRNGFRPAWYFLIANLVLIPLIYITIYYSLSSTTVLSVYESIPGRILISSAMHSAALLQILIFSYGIVRKMRLDEIERKRAQDQVIEQLRINESLKDKVNRELEQKVKERTREINEQKEEIESQRDEIEAQRDMVAMQRDLVSEQKKEITDSIDYAQRIQLALLPGKEYLDQIMPEHFVFYKPKDVVSGDFYWIREVHDSLIVVVADCTGHGVPGAFMSMLGITLLDEEFGKPDIGQAGEILENLRSRLKKMLVQSGQSEEQKDGMDLALAIIDKKNKELQFAGANNPLLLLRNSKLVTGTEQGFKTTLQSKGSHLFEFKGDRQPIGVHWEETRFTTHRIKLLDQDSLYVFTDGFVDQFGGEHRKKFKSKRFKELLLSLQNEKMDTQKKVLEQTFEKWRNEVEQIDDVCIVGLRL